MTDTATPAPSAIATTPPPGWKTSEAWISFLTILVGAIPNSGLVANAPLAAKIVGMIAAAITAWMYTTNRTSLKRAHLAAATAPTPTPVPIASKIGLATLLVSIGAALSCATTSKTATAIVAGGDAFLQCEGTDLAQLVTDANGKTLSLLSAVANDLIGANYEQAIADLIGAKGANVVGCAVLAVDTVVEAGKTSGAAALSPIEARAREMMAKYTWRAAPAAPAAKTGSGSAAAP